MLSNRCLGPFDEIFNQTKKLRYRFDTINSDGSISSQFGLSLANFFEAQSPAPNRTGEKLEVD